MRWTREQYLDLMAFRPVSRPMFVEPFGLLIGLEAQWREQGASDGEIDLSAFDFDFVQRVGAGGNCGAIGLPKTVVLEESPTHRIERDGLGRTVLIDKRTATIGLPQNYPVVTIKDWLKLKPHFAWHESRINSAQMQKAVASGREGWIVQAGIPGAYDTLRELMGEEWAAVACYEEPELVQDIMQTLRSTAMAVLERVSERVRIDVLSVHEDMAGKSGPLIGPRQMQQFVKPYYRPVWEMLASRGTPIFGMDTDGNVNAILDDLIDCGLTHLYPMEPAAGMDMVAVRRKYGRALTFLGGIDKFAVMKSREAIDAELEYKLQPMMREGGGVAFGLDHRIPNGTPLELYRYYVDRAREILGLPRRSSEQRGWARMAM